MSASSTVSVILVAMAIVAGVEAAVPLHARGSAHRRHLAPNLALTAIAFATNAAFDLALVLALARAEARGVGLLPRLGVGPTAATAIVVVALDLAFWVAHVAMHRIPALWRFHRVHHADPALDVTTTIRQHPGESVVRYVAMAACAVPLGAGPGAFAVYRTWSALSGLVEHANVRAPARLDRMLALVTTWPHMHKVHHSRRAVETNTNYGNILSLWDRLLGTYTPSARGADVVVGLDGFDDPATQTTTGLLALPFRRDDAVGATAAAPS